LLSASLHRLSLPTPPIRYLYPYTNQCHRTVTQPKTLVLLRLPKALYTPTFLLSQPSPIPRFPVAALDLPQPFSDPSQYGRTIIELLEQTSLASIGGQRDGRCTGRWSCRWGEERVSRHLGHPSSGLSVMSEEQRLIQSFILSLSPALIPSLSLDPQSSLFDDVLMM
jgi:hypothetical protein